MVLSLIAGTANPPLAAAVAQFLGVELASVQLQRFPDGELHVNVAEPLRGRDVYVVQATAPPVDQHLMELLLVADACRRAGAARISAVIPYFGYARQDRRVRGREAIGALVACQLLRTSGVERLVALDLHSTAIEGFFPGPVEHLTAVPLLAEALRSTLPANPVLISPDLGAVKLATRYSRLLGAPVAVIHKVRISGTEVETHGMVGDVRDRAPVIVDDMVSTGGTLEAAMETALARGATRDVVVACSHALMVGRASERLCSYPIKKFLTTDSVGFTAGPLLPYEVVSVAPLLAEAVLHLHRDESLAHLRAEQ